MMSIATLAAPTPLPDRQLFHLTHRSSLAPILQAGCLLSPGAQPADVPRREIWDAKIVASRAKFEVPYPSGATVASFVAFAFSAKTPSSYAVATGYGVPKIANDDLVILRTSPRALLEHMVPVTVVDRVPLNRNASFSVGTETLANLDWELFRVGDFQNTKEDTTRTTRAGAELLAFHRVPLAAIDALLCWNDGADLVKALQTIAGTTPSVVRDTRAFYSRGA